MEIITTFIALFFLSYVILLSIEFVIGFNLLKNLAKQKKLPDSELPSLSIVLSALNEENDIEFALKSMLQIDYPNFEIIVINDRSTDSTPAILNKMKQDYPQLNVIHVSQLPAGWMGKNHALYIGAKEAQGEWILFTDADVQMLPEAVTRAISYALEKKIDHLTIFENHVRNTFWLKVLLLANYFSYSLHFRPWRIRFSWSSSAIGHGAFNLVKKSSYQACGGHSAIAMECLDDLKLGYLMKCNGYKQDTVDGRDYVQREWYATLRDMKKGFEKNAFSIFNYKFFALTTFSILGLLFFVWPFIAIFLFKGTVLYLNLAIIVLTLLLAMQVAEKFRMKKELALLYPIGISILLYVTWNSASKIYMNKGITWRGTLYPLESLRKK